MPFPGGRPARGGQLGSAASTSGRSTAGSALSRLDAAIVFEELAAGCTSTAAYISIHNMVAWMIDAFAAAEQRARWLPDLMHHGAVRQLLPDRAGLRLGRAASRPAPARRRSLRPERHQGVHLGRRRRRRLRAAWCAPAERGRRDPASSWEQGTPGLSFGAQEKKLGWHSQPTAMVILEDCRVPVASASAREGEGFKIAMQGLDGGRINIAACALGGARCLRAHQRTSWSAEQFGTPAGRLSGVAVSPRRHGDRARGGAADAVSGGRGARPRRGRDHGLRDGQALRDRYRLQGVQCCLAVARRLWLHARSTPSSADLRDVRVHQILEGTNEIMRLIIARRLLDS